MAEAPELRRARFHLLRAQDALDVAIASLRATPVSDSVRIMLTEQADAVQRQVNDLLDLLGSA